MPLWDLFLLVLLGIGAYEFTLWVLRLWEGR